MATRADQEFSPDLPLPEQDFVDSAYERLDSLRASYRARQGRVHSTHGVGNAQGWTEREALSAHLGEMAARLEGVEERLVFGRLDLADQSVRHVGRLSLTREDGSTLLVDWRAPAARPFYQATSAEPDGVVRRRHISTRERRVTGLEDELLDASRASGLELQGEGALMHALSEARDGRMGDIVATIQSEQDRIIRASDRGLLVVQGGPGTGKTAVALHRIAYLLYAHRERLERSGVLLVGPSPLFLRYIEQVLPSLGETGVVSVTLGDLVPGVRARASEDERVARIKGLPAWARIIREAVRALAKLPEGDQVLRVWNREVTLRRTDVEAARRRAKRSGRPHNTARESFARELMDVLARRLAREAGDADSDGTVEAEVRRSWLAEIRDSVDCRRAINSAWMPTSAQTLLRRLYARPEVLAAANRRAGSPLRAEELAAVRRARSAPWSVQDVPILDECEELLGPMPASAPTREVDAGDVERARAAIEGQHLGGGIVTAEMLAASVGDEPSWTPLSERAAKDRTWAYGHIVVDEAQELSPMAWRCLLRRCPSRSFTVVGDLDQRRGHERPPSWEKALGPAARALAGEYALTVSYRTPATLTKLAEGVLARAGAPVLYPMTAVRDVEGCYRVTRVEPATGAAASRTEDALRKGVEAARREAEERLDREAGASSGRIAIIVGEERTRAWGADLGGETALSERVSLLSAVASKGLEFDSVILVEPGEIAADGIGDLFVALTRATHDVHVVHAEMLPAGMDEWSS